MTPYISRELLDIGYNWKLQASKLFVEVYNDIEKSRTSGQCPSLELTNFDIQKACIKVTNPLCTDKLSVFELSLQKRLESSLKITQKLSL